MAQRKSVEERFWEKVDRSGGPDACWEWQASTFHRGYGKFYVDSDRRAVSAHRFAYELTRDPIPEGVFVCHACDNRACVNPTHLWVGTAADNTHDCIQKGRKNTPRGESHSSNMREVAARGEQNGAAKLTAEKVRQIRLRYSQDGITFERLATEYGVRNATIHRIIHRKTWNHVTDNDEPIDDEKVG